MKVDETDSESDTLFLFVSLTPSSHFLSCGSMLLHQNIIKFVGYEGFNLEIKHKTSKQYSNSNVFDPLDLTN